MGIGTDLFAIEHILPESVGGPTNSLNLALSCSSCNTFKGVAITGNDPLSERSVPLFHPRQNLWDEHFLWSEDFLRVVGSTATGRATVALLRMNQSALVNLRRVLRDTGLHPPSITPASL